MNWKIRAGKWHDQVCVGEGQILHPKTEVWGEQRKERKEKEARETYTGRRRKKEGGRKRKGGRIKEEGREGRRNSVSVSDLIVFSLPTDGGGEEAGNMGPSWKCPSSSFSTLRVSPLPILLSKIRSGCREKLKWLGGEAPGSHTSVSVLASLSLLWSLSGPSCWSLRQASLVKFTASLSLLRMVLALLDLLALTLGRFQPSVFSALSSPQHAMNGNQKPACAKTSSVVHKDVPKVWRRNPPCPVVSSTAV